MSVRSSRKASMVDAPGCRIYSRIDSRPFGRRTVSARTWSSTPSNTARDEIVSSLKSGSFTHASMSSQPAARPQIAINVTGVGENQKKTHRDRVELPALGVHRAESAFHQTCDESGNEIAGDE